MWFLHVCGLGALTGSLVLIFFTPAVQLIIFPPGSRAANDMPGKPVFLSAPLSITLKDEQVRLLASVVGVVMKMMKNIIMVNKDFIIPNPLFAGFTL